MTRYNVRSTNLKSVGYDDKNMILEVEFHNGGVYQFYDVPVSLHGNLMRADSKGKFFAANINKKFLYKKVWPPSAR